MNEQDAEPRKFEYAVRQYEVRIEEDVGKTWVFATDAEACAFRGIIVAKLVERRVPFDEANAAVTVVAVGYTRTMLRDAIIDVLEEMGQ